VTESANRNAFDECVGAYNEGLQKGLSVSGENKDYFARRRVEWTAARLGSSSHVRMVIDYGCGTGDTTPFLIRSLRPKRLLGMDVSRESLKRAATQYGACADFCHPDAYRPDAAADLIYTNGTFHHVDPSQRGEAIAYLHRCLRPAGYVAFWENNPWNPGTRIVMKRIPFDRDARPLSAPRARRLLEEGGFHVDRTDYLFIFPRALRLLRFLEPRLTSLPCGAQYMLLARKPQEL
jgi:SAM-dependent methyltransferase